MKIAFCINTAWNIYNFRKILIDHFISQGHEVICIAPKDDFSEKLKALGCRVVDIKLNSKGSNPVQDLNFGIKLSQILKKEKPDALLSYTIKPNIYGSLFSGLHKVPVIANVSGLGTTFIRENLTSFFAKLLYRISLKRAAVVFFQNREDLELFSDLGLVPAEKARLIPGSGVDTNLFSAEVVQTENSGVFTFLMLSRIIYDKGIRELLDASKTLAEKNKDFRVILSGKIEDDARLGPTKEEFLKSIENSPVEYRPFSERIRELVAGSDCVILPSYREGLPKSLLEGASMQKPLIATDVPGCREVVKDGLNGFLCRPMDHQSLAEAMKRILDTPRGELENMGSHGRRLVVDRFSKDLVIEAYSKALEKVLN